MTAMLSVFALTEHGIFSYTPNSHVTWQPSQKSVNHKHGPMDPVVITIGKVVAIYVSNTYYYLMEETLNMFLCLRFQN